MRTRKNQISIVKKMKKTCAGSCAGDWAQGKRRRWLGVVFENFIKSSLKQSIIAPINRYIKDKSNFKVENLKMNLRRNRLCQQ